MLDLNYVIVKCGTSRFKKKKLILEGSRIIEKILYLN